MQDKKLYSLKPTFFNTIPHLTKAYTLPYEVLNVFLHILFIHVSNKISVNQSEEDVI